MVAFLLFILALFTPLPFDEAEPGITGTWYAQHQGDLTGG